MKIVYSPDVGGLIFNTEFLKRYYECKGYTVFKFPDSCIGGTTEHLAQSNLFNIDLLTIDNFEKDCLAVNKAGDNCSADLYYKVRDTVYSNVFSKNVLEIFDRADPLLVSIVEEMGGKCHRWSDSIIKIADLPTGTKYRINDMSDSGAEILETPESINWDIAT
jgi:hypothetical protein